MVELGPFTMSWGELVKSRDLGLIEQEITRVFTQHRHDTDYYWDLLMEEDTMEDKIKYACETIEDMLLAKNEAYGNSALDPVRIFSTASSVAQLYVRIDDKLSRIKRGHQYDDEDTILDLIGYLVLLKIALEERE